jgi:hypothetical protein
MLNKSVLSRLVAVLSLLVAVLALLASPGLVPPVAANPTRWLVGADTASCAGSIPDFTTITEAVLTASPGDTIHVCPGDYTEADTIISDDELTIEGSGASVTHIHLSGGGEIVFGIEADRVVIQGLDVDATPSPGDLSVGIIVLGDSVTIQNNEIRNATVAAVLSAAYATPRYAQVLNNDMHDNVEGALGTWDDSALSGNTVQLNAGGYRALSIMGDRGSITGNVVVDGTVQAIGDDLFVSNNQISGTAVGGLLDVRGNRIGVTDNTLSDTTGYGIHALTETPSGVTSTSVTIARNTFSQVAAPIRLLDSIPGDGFTLTATIGGSASEANTFTHSGGSLGDSNYLVQMDGATFDVNAEYNKWGLCTAAEIEQEIYDKADDPALGAVDFEPFIAPSSCSPTPTPTATPTRTPTPTSTATPIPGPTRTVTIPSASWANFTWSGASSPQTVADCFGTGNVAVMYRLDATTGTFQRWIRGRDDLSNMTDVLRYDALLALNTSAQPATCTMPNVLLARSLTIPTGSWANFAWTGAAILPAAATAQCFGEGNVAVMYRLNASTQTFARWIRGRDDLSNMGEVYPYDALLALNGSGQPANCTFPVLATSDLPEPG